MNPWDHIAGDNTPYFAHRMLGDPKNTMGDYHRITDGH